MSNHSISAGVDLELILCWRKWWIHSNKFRSVLFNWVTSIYFKILLVIQANQITMSVLIIYNMDSQGAFRIIVEGFILLVALHFLELHRIFISIANCTPSAYFPEATIRVHNKCNVWSFRMHSAETCANISCLLYYMHRSSISLF